jgi:hypothetical protein
MLTGVVVVVMVCVMGYGIVMMGGVMMYDVVVWLREMCT